MAEETERGTPGSEAGRGGTAGWSVPELLVPLWQERLPALVERLQVVELALQAGPGEPAEDGLMMAHKLHGVLGTFGHMQGSVIAGRAEALLGSPDHDPQARAAVALQCRELRDELAAMLPDQST